MAKTFETWIFLGILSSPCPESLSNLLSLRDRIGVVPQTPILFDDTIMNNVRYGRITATDEEIYEACEAACIHDKIKGFTHGLFSAIDLRFAG